jgi:hypothetical protein
MKFDALNLDSSSFSLGRRRLTVVKVVGEATDWMRPDERAFRKLGFGQKVTFRKADLSGVGTPVTNDVPLLAEEILSEIFSSECDTFNCQNC